MQRTLLERSTGVFLDLKSCGSSIRWGVTVTRTDRRDKKTKKLKTSYGFDAEVNLTDCSRGIRWDGDGRPALMLKKLNTAIATLNAMRVQVRRASKMVPRKARREYF